MKDTMISVFKPFRPIHYGITGLLALALLFRFISAAPNWIHYDENYYLNIAQNYIDRGELTPYMWRLDEGTNIIAGSGSGYGILVLTNWMKLFGVSLFGGRVLMILVGLATAGVMYHVGRLWWNSRAAGVVALGFALVGTSPFYSYVIRMDSLGMLAYSLVLLLHVYAVRRQKKRLHFWVGVGVVAAAEFHILSTLYLVALTLYYLIRYGQELLARRRLVLDTGPVYFGLGGLMAGLIYVAVHILPDPQSYFAISSQCFQCEPDILNKEFLRLARFMLLRSVEFALLVAALMSAYFRRQADDRHLTLGWLLAQALIGTPPFTHYTYHIWPLVAVGTAGFITRGVRAGGQLSPRRLRFGLALAAFTLVLNLGLSLLGRQPFELRYDTEITPQAAYVRAHIDPQTVIAAHPTYFYGLRDYANFLSLEDIDNPALRGGLSKTDYLNTYQPLVIVGDSWDGDPELDQYMTEMNFTQVMPDLWLAADLRAALPADTTG